MPTRTRPIHRLKTRDLDAITKPGRHGDGGNLYLSVSPSEARSWVLLYRWHGKLTEIGLGSLREVPLARAPSRRAARQQIANGENPKQSRPRGNDDATFGACAARLIENSEAVMAQPAPRSAMAGHLDQGSRAARPHAGQQGHDRGRARGPATALADKAGHGAAATRSHRTRA